MLKDSDLIKIEDMKRFESNDLETLLHKILNYLKHITFSDAGTIYLKEEDYLTFYIFQNNSFSYETIYKLQEPLKNLKFQIKQNSHTIAIESFLSKKIITIDDIYDDKVFDFKSSKEFDKNFNYKTKSILTAPLINFYNGEVIGVLQLINKKDGEKLITFSEDDKEFLSLSSYLITLSILTTQQSIKDINKMNEEIENRIILRTKTLEEIQQQLLEQVNKDSMTGLFNRKYFYDIATNLLSLVQKTNIEMLIIMLDIDDFKLINDTYGHFSGDEVICSIANLLRQSTRNSDICVRFGGEEFVIILPNTSLANGVKIAEKIRQSIEQNVVNINENQQIHYTISLGISKVEREDNSLEIALNKADILLYEAKRLGKNQIRF
jgi:diguanylate cyclase (GGDEF)-like protein